MSQLPFAGIRIIEICQSLAGRLTGLLFADQGAAVYIQRNDDFRPEARDEYLDRNKLAVPVIHNTDIASADIIIVDGTDDQKRQPEQILLRITAAVPGDDQYDHLTVDCSDDLLNALTGFYTDMATTGQLLGRTAIYTPLPLCSVYAGVNGAVATGAAMVDKVRCGKGREIIISRLAAGVSAIGIHALRTSGEPQHVITHCTRLDQKYPVGNDWHKRLDDAANNPEKQLLLEQQLFPLNAPYRCSDGRFILPITSLNRRLARSFCQTLGIWDAIKVAGVVDLDPYDPANVQYHGRNIADAPAFSFSLNVELAALISTAMLKKTALEWEQQFCSSGIPAVMIRSFNQWLNDKSSRSAKLIADVKGHGKRQLGRAVWIASAQPYPDLKACERHNSIPATSPMPSKSHQLKPNKLPLTGITVVDLSNVIAGPNCGRMLAELGATVYKIDPLQPQHIPTAMITWAAESGAGKASIILDIKTHEGADILTRLLKKSDIILINKQDDQMIRLGFNRQSLARINPKIIGIQLTAHKGELPSAHANYPGYGPALQGTTGLMLRFGTTDCPTFHGLSSTVDYLCGYLGAWAGISALYARAMRQDGEGDWAETSLAAAASLTQLLFQQAPAPRSAQGPYATGMNAHDRLYQLSDGWIFAEGQHDLSDDLMGCTVNQALSRLQTLNIQAVPVKTCREIAEQHLKMPCRTITCEKREANGWHCECFTPSWFVFDGEPLRSRGAAFRVGSNACTILKTLGYSDTEIAHFIDTSIVGNTEWQSEKK